ncbi:hypothetical protein DdX_14542 [Ditylenchus destructor]|uniref:Uncharacterized protein n=1 Tax=Ditylenchus destructor TaxID=166010 RepID=A0AAD4MUC8_9BILA|nr:hypothetical protein DdX_14542 [Ditylenchus destructor]
MLFANISTKNHSITQLYSLLTLIYLFCLEQTIHALPPNGRVQQWERYFPFSSGNSVDSLSRHVTIHGKSDSKSISEPIVIEDQRPIITDAIDIKNFCILKNYIQLKSKRDDVAVKLWNWAKNLNAKNPQPNMDMDFDGTNGTMSDLEPTTIQSPTKLVGMAEKVLQSNRFRHSLRLHQW